MADTDMACATSAAKASILKPNGRPIGVKRTPHVCVGCACHVEARRFGEWICGPCKTKKNRDWKIRAGLVRATPGVLPAEISDAKWRSLEDRNARDAWQYWLTQKASPQWLEAYHSRKPWRLSSCKSEEYRVRYRADAEFRLRQILRNYERKAERGRYGEALRQALKAGTIRCRAAEACGYTMKQLKCHLERQFSKGMTWAKFNQAEIHIDHIVPLSAFDLADPLEYRAAWALTNLRPMWARHNLAKAAQRTHLL